MVEVVNRQGVGTGGEQEGTGQEEEGTIHEQDTNTRKRGYERTIHE
jgi:hypothetical protein